ncbi:MAG: hypothetical protein ACR2M1_04260 [Gemmatimonadaceae bacterium]
MAAAASGTVGDTTVRVIYDSHGGMAIESADGILRTPVRGASVEASAAVSVDTDAKELQRAVAEISIGMDADASPLTLSVGGLATVVEASRARAMGRTTVMQAIAAAHKVDGSTLPVLAAFALRAAGLANGDSTLLANDTALKRLAHAMRLGLPNREYEVWTVEAPAWVLAAADVLEARDAEERKNLLTSAESQLLEISPDANEISALERDYCYTMVLLAACHDGRERVPGPVRSAVPYGVAVGLVGGTSSSETRPAGLPNPTLTPSEEERRTAVSSHSGICSAAPSYSAVLAILGRGSIADDAALDIDTRRNIATVANGEVREINSSFALRLTAVPIHVLRGALRAHGRLDDEIMRDLPVDDRARTEMVADAWPAATLTPEALERIESAAGRTTLRLDSAAQKQVRQKRQDAQRSARRLTVVHLVPGEVGAGTVRRIRVPSQVMATTSVNRVADVGGQLDAESTRIILALPPAALALAAIDAGAPILCNMAHRSAAVVVPCPQRTKSGKRFSLLGTWSADVAASAPSEIVRAALSASPRDVVVLWGDEVLAARAAASDADQALVGNPGDGIDVAVTRNDAGVVIEAGVSTITIGPERAGYLMSVRERMAGSASLAEAGLTGEARRVLITEGAVKSLANALAAGAALQGVGRTSDGEGLRGIGPADARVTLIASAGSGYVGLHDGVREHVVTPAIAETRGAAGRVTLAPGALADAIDVARASGDAQEARRVDYAGAKFGGTARLRFLPGGEAIRVERGRINVTAMIVDAEANDADCESDAEETDEYDVSASIAAVAARAGM